MRPRNLKNLNNTELLLEFYRAQAEVDRHERVGRVVKADEYRKIRQVIYNHMTECEKYEVEWLLDT